MLRDAIVQSLVERGWVRADAETCMDSFAAHARRSGYDAMRDTFGSDAVRLVYEIARERDIALV